MLSLNNWLRNHPIFTSFLYRSLGRNRYKIKQDNSLLIKGCFIKKTRIIVNGKNNKVHIIGGNTRLRHCSIYVSGNDNHITISSGCLLDNVEIYIEDDANQMFIGEGVEMYGRVHLAVTEGTSLWIGKKCLFSQNVIIRTGDSHSILDAETGLRVNPAKNVKICDHVWVGNGVTILKGSVIQSDSVVAANALVTGKDYYGGMVYGGNPAKVLRSGIQWDIRRL